ncbi:MAG TPA: META domain-containing protein [Anaerolineales bacterium]|nr:META domain-containing protein [Anaerolineales bacterium]
MDKLVVSLFILFVLAACGNASPGSIQGKWILISYGSPTDQIAAVPDVDAFIEFDSEGKMTGSVGCNGFGGAYEVDSDMINFNPIESTLMFCEGPVGDQELATFATLQEITTFEIDGNMLTITSADGNSSIVLERK